MTDNSSVRTGWLVRLTIALSVLVVAGALVVAWWQRPDAGESGAQRSAAPTTNSSGQHCGKSQCDVVDSSTVNGHEVQLLAGSDGRVGKLRVTGPSGAQVIGVSVTRLGVVLDENSLECTPGTTPACLVSGPQGGGMIGEVLLPHGQKWNSPARPYFSNAGMIALDDVAGDDSPEVVVVEHDCGPDTERAACEKVPVVATVYDLGGSVVGCSENYPWPARIPGWPEIELPESQLRSCD